MKASNLTVQQLKQLQEAAVLQLGYLCGRMERLGGHKYNGTYGFRADEDPELVTLFMDGLMRGYDEQTKLEPGEV